MVGKRASFLLALWSLAASLTATYGQIPITLSFVEVDFSASERDDHVDVGVFRTGRVSGSLTYTITPLSLEQAAARYNYTVDGGLDPAEPGEDFSPEVIVRTVQSTLSRGEEAFTIELMDDDTQENNEVFLLRLDVTASDPSEQERLTFGDQWTLIRIRADADMSSLSVSILRDDVRESDGVIENFITIVKEGQSEIPLPFSITANSGTATSGVDFVIEQGAYSLQPEEQNRTFSLTILEDDIPENTERIRLVINRKQYPVNLMDNDNMTVGIINGTELEVEEGGSVTVCVGVISPPVVEREVVLQGALVSGTARESIDYTPASATPRGFTFNLVDTLPVCREIRTVNDDTPELVENFSFSLPTTQPNDLTIVEPHTLTITVTDSDVPQLRAEVSRAGSPGTAATVEEGEGMSDDFIRIFTHDPHPNPVELTVTIETSNADIGQDFFMPTGTFTFFPENSSLLLPLTVFEDDFVEVDEEFTVTISQPGTSYPPLTLTITINDTDPVTVGFANDTVLMVTEGDTVRVCGKVVDVAPSLVQRLLVLEGHTIADTAEDGSDFTPLSWNYTFSSNITFMCVNIATGGDDVPELLETFRVSLQPLGPSRLVTVQPDILRIEIVNDDVPQLEVEVVGSPSLTATVSEGDGPVGNLLRVFTAGIHPFELIYSISVAPSGGSDFNITEGPVSFSPSDTEHFIPLTILEDSVAEENETLTITVFQAGFSSRTISITIRDNDVLRVGFLNRSEVTAEEGGEVTLCARILSPELVERSVRVQARTVQFTAKAGVDYTATENGWTLSSPHRTVCMDVHTIENSKPEHPRELQVRLEFEEPSSLLLLEPATVTVVVLDNDGTPLAPQVTDIKLHPQEDGKYNLTFAWSAEVEELRPIDFFTGTVTARNVLEQGEVKQKRESAGEERRRRATEDEVVSLTPLYFFRVDPGTTEYTVVNVQLAEEYLVEVCSNNKLGFNCSAPETLSSGFLKGGVTTDEGDDELAAEVIVAIVLLLLLVLLCCCFFCCGLCFFLCCYREKDKAYYPEEKEKKNQEEFAKYRAMEEDMESESDSELGDVV